MHERRGSFRRSLHSCKSHLLEDSDKRGPSSNKTLSTVYTVRPNYVPILFHMKHVTFGSAAAMLRR